MFSEIYSCNIIYFKKFLNKLFSTLTTYKFRLEYGTIFNSIIVTLKIIIILEKFRLINTVFFAYNWKLSRNSLKFLK